MPKLGGPRAHNRFEAELTELTRALQSYGVLTHERLKELSGSGHWSGPVFEAVLAEAIRQGRVRRLGHANLYELNEPDTGAAA